MKEYPHIDTLYKRTEDTKVIIIGDYTCDEFKYLSELEWHGTEKIDGTNIRVMYQDGKVRFGGRSENSQIPAKLISVLEEMFPVEKFSKFDSICLYGEGYGAGIQTGGIYRPTQSFILFDVLIDGWWLKRESLVDIANQFEIDLVDLVFSGTIDQANQLVSTGFKSSLTVSADAEGLVLQPAIPLLKRNGSRIITKLKTKDFRDLERKS